MSFIIDKQILSPLIKENKSDLGDKEKPFISVSNKFNIFKNQDPLKPVCPVKKIFFLNMFFLNNQNPLIPCFPNRFIFPHFFQI